MAFDLGSDWMVFPWLAAALLVLWWVQWRGGPALARSRHWLLWVFRVGVLAALVMIGLNPVLVAVAPGSIRRPEVHVLLDASQSMMLGSPNSRWQEGTELLRTALDRQEEHADVRIHRFGQRLVAVDLPAFLTGSELSGPDDADTQLTAAFQQLAGRLGREGPAAVVVVSDGRVRDAEKVNEMASLWHRLRIPVYVVPLGRAAEGGDAAILGAIAPAKARKQAHVDVRRVRIIVGVVSEAAGEAKEAGCGGAFKHKDADLSTVDFDFERKVVVGRSQVVGQWVQVQPQTLEIRLRAEGQHYGLYAVLQSDRERGQAAADLSGFIRGLEP